MIAYLLRMLGVPTDVGGNDESIADALATLAKDPSDKHRLALYERLRSGTLFVAARELPEELRNTGKLTSDMTVPLLTSASPDGGVALLAFTSEEEVHKRAPGAHSLEMHATTVLQRVVDAGLDALILNPAGPWAGVPREDVEKILQSESRSTSSRTVVRRGRD